MRKCKLSDFGNDVDVMMIHIVDLQDEIIQDNYCHTNMEMDKIASLLISTNKEFKDFVMQIKGNWELGQDYPYGSKIAEVATKFNNLKLGKVWGKLNHFSKILLLSPP